VKHTAVVLAGSRPGRDAFAEQFGTDLKALIPIAGEPMVRRPVRALLASKQVGEVLVLSQSPERIGGVLTQDPRIRVRQSRGTIAETMLELLEDGETQWPLLVTTADHALLDTATVDEFLGAAAGADIAVGVVERTSLLRRLPLTERTWLKFRGGAYTGANLFVLHSLAVRPAIELWRSVEQDRKKVGRVIALLGPLTMLVGVVWAILQPYRVTLLHPRGEEFWWLAVQPPLLVLVAGAAFHLLVARPLVRDLEEDA
jgi:GTP:adenosylcobinamide-phosphate guanylyltransferase